MSQQDSLAPSQSGREARILDVRGLHCPLPILRTRALIDTMTAGDELLVHATDPASVIDFKHFCNTTQHELLAHTVSEGVLTYHIRCGGPDAG